jgi:glucose/arabinose dehydrogenase
MSKLVLLILLFPVYVAAATLPTGFKATKVATVTKPTAMAVAPDSRIFVCEQTGKVRVIKNGALLSQPFLSLSVNSTGEHGLLGIALDPAFTANKWIYVFYNPSATTTRISRFTAQGDVVASGSELILLSISGLTSQNRHVGGGLSFGPSDKLFISVGDNAKSSNAQSLSNLFGKILRINKDGTIPGDNPFYNQATGKNRAIWALGLRNPFSFAFLHGGSKMNVNDVGDTKFEEINILTKGANYGWPTSDGPTDCGGGLKCPSFSYPHGAGVNAGCAIVGATFYDPFVMQFPAGYQSDYFFADLCNGWIRRRDSSTNVVSTFAQGLSNPIALAVDSVTGTFYYAQRGTSVGAVYKVTF